MKKQFTHLFTIGVFSCYVASMTLSQLPLWKETFVSAKTNNTKNEVVDYQKTFLEFESSFAENLENKNDYITLNGGFARLLGEKELNDRVKIGENLYSYEKTNTDYSVLLENMSTLIAFSNYLEERDIPFLYIQTPNPVSPSGEELESWMANTINEKATIFVEGLREEGIHVLDIREVMVAEGMSFSEATYKTDHHWKYETAFWACGLALEEMSQLTGLAFDPFYSDLDNWTQTLYEDSFLGSHGKREGPLYAGVDDVNVILPDFETSITYQVPYNEIKKTGDLKTVFTNESLLEINRVEDYMTKTGYQYYSGDYGYDIITNHLAYHDFKVLVVDDSFGHPFTRYLIPHVSELHMVDFRREATWEEYDFFQILEEIQPDLVYILMSPGASGNVTDRFQVNPPETEG